MTTSGTIGQTIVTTAKIIEHALRRCKFDVTRQTPEVIEIAKSCLYMLLANYANSPLNLWCIERVLLGYRDLQKSYNLPKGTSSLLSVLHASPSIASGSLQGNTFVLDALTTVQRVGVSFSTLPASDFVISASTDGSGYTDVQSVKLIANEIREVDQLYWFELDPQVPASHVQVSSGTVRELLVCYSVAEVPIDPMNRDTYANLPNKQSSASRPTSYLFEKTIDPSIIFWPVPSDAESHAVVEVHRQVQDVGGLTNTLAIPTRWYDATVMQLAFRLSLELPGVDDARVALLKGLADQFTLDASSEETDSAPIYIQPRIQAYTK